MAAVVPSLFTALKRRETGKSDTRTLQTTARSSEELIRRLSLSSVLEGHEGCVNACSFSPTGELLLTGSDDTNVILWDWQNEKIRLQYDSGHTNNVFQTKMMDRCEHTIVTCAADGAVRVGHLSGAGVETRQLHRHRGRAHKLGLVHSSPFNFLSTGEDGDVVAYDLREPGSPNVLTTVAPVTAGKEASMRRRSYVGLNSIDVSRSNPLQFVVAGDDAFVRIYDRRKSAEVCGYFCPSSLDSGEQYLSHVTCAMFSETGTEIIASYSGESLYLFETEQGQLDGTGCDVKQEYVGHRNIDTVKGVNFIGPNSEFVVSGSDCGHIYIWRRKGGELVQRLRGDDHVVNCVEPHPSLPIMATAGIDDTVKVWSPLARKRCRGEDLHVEAITPHHGSTPALSSPPHLPFISPHVHLTFTFPPSALHANASCVSQARRVRPLTSSIDLLDLIFGVSRRRMSWLQMPLMHGDDSDDNDDSSEEEEEESSEGEEGEGSYDGDDDGSDSDGDDGDGDDGDGDGDEQGESEDTDGGGDPTEPDNAQGREDSDMGEVNDETEGAAEPDQNGTEGNQADGSN